MTSFLIETRLPPLLVETAPTGNLPAVVPPKLPLVEEYRRVDAAMGKLEDALSRAAHNVGTRAPVLETTKRNVDRFAVGAGLLVAGLSACLGWIGPVGWENTVLSGCVGLITGLLTAGAAPLIADSIAPHVARRPLSGDKLTGLRNVASGNYQSAEAVGLAIAARKWLATLDDRQVHAWEARDVLGKLAKADESRPEERARIERWSALRSAIAAIEARPKACWVEAANVQAAFRKLTAEEKRALGPVVLERLYVGEVPRFDNLAFRHTNELYADIHRAVHGLPDPPERNDADDPLQKIAVYVPGPPEESDAPVAKNDAVAELVALRRSFDTAITDIWAEAAGHEAGRVGIRAPKNRYSGPRSTERATRLASDPARTPLERFALGLSARKAWVEMYDRHIHGFAAREAVEAIMAAAREAGTAPVLDRLKRIDDFLAELHAHPPDFRFDEGWSAKLLASIKNLLPGDRASAAKLALGRFFVNEAPGGPTPYRVAKPLADGLRAYIA